MLKLRKRKIIQEYQFRNGTRYSVDAQVVGEHLEEITNKHGGLNPHLVVREAERKNSPLHDCFTWDDTSAAEKYRLQEARMLIGSVMVVTQQIDEPIRAFHSVKVNTNSSEDDAETRAYVSLDVALSDEEYRRQLLQQAARDLNTWRKKYGELQELYKFFSEAQRIIERYSA